MFKPLILFYKYRTISIAVLAYRGARGAESTATASSSSGSVDSYNGDDAWRYLRWWKGIRDLYSEATREIVHLQLCS
jgi:hypothetical protein